jgi:hypothetical protein
MTASILVLLLLSIRANVCDAMMHTYSVIGYDSIKIFIKNAVK